MMNIETLLRMSNVVQSVHIRHALLNELVKLAKQQSANEVLDELKKYIAYCDAQHSLALIILAESFDTANKKRTLYASDLTRYQRVLRKALINYFETFESEIE